MCVRGRMECPIDAAALECDGQGPRRHPCPLAQARPCCLLAQAGLLLTLVASQWRAQKHTRMCYCAIVWYGVLCCCVMLCCVVWDAVMMCYATTTCYLRLYSTNLQYIVLVVLIDYPTVVRCVGRAAS